MFCTTRKTLIYPSKGIGLRNHTFEHPLHSIGCRIETSSICVRRIARYWQPWIGDPINSSPTTFKEDEPSIIRPTAHSVVVMQSLPGSVIQTSRLVFTPARVSRRETGIIQSLVPSDYLSTASWFPVNKFIVVDPKKIESGRVHCMLW